MSYQSEPLSLWIDRRMVLRRSRIHGIGTFATEAIPAGQLLIMTTGGLVVTPADRQSEAFDIEDDLYNEESLPGNLRILTPKVFHYYINHCCAPNAVDLTRSLNSTHYIALRNIEAQEEITTDFGMIGASVEQCHCMAPRCRGRVTTDDWRIPELQQRYRGYFSWPIEQKIQQANQAEDSTQQRTAHEYARTATASLGREQ